MKKWVLWIIICIICITVLLFANRFVGHRISINYENAHINEHEKKDIFFEDAVIKTLILSCLFTY